MARETGPQCKQCRREGQKLFLKGERCLTDKCGVERRSYPLLRRSGEAVPRLLREGLPPAGDHR
jgi:hypothetical protein